MSKLIVVAENYILSFSSFLAIFFINVTLTVTHDYVNYIHAVIKIFVGSY